jgi:hypothetical protein
MAIPRQYDFGTPPGTKGSTTHAGNRIKLAVPTGAGEFNSGRIGPASDSPAFDNPSQAASSGVTGGQTTEGGTQTSKSLEIGGSSILVEESGGSETITISHSSGAGIQIAADGTINIIGTSSKDMIISSPNISLIANEGLKLKASKFYGEFDEFDVRTNDYRLFVSGDMTEFAEGSREMNTDGFHSFNVTKDYNEIVGGDKRTSVAGDERQQNSGEKRFDIEQRLDIRANQQIDIATQKALNLFAEKQIAANAKEEFTVSSDGELLLESGSSISVVANENLSLSGYEGIFQRTNDQFTISSKNNVNIDSDNNYRVRTSNVRYDADATYVVRSEASEIHSDTTMDIRADDVLLNSESEMNIKSGNLNINATGPIDLRGVPVDLNKGAPESPLAPTTFQPKETTEAPKNDDSVESGKAAEVPSDEEILDSMTTERKDAVENPENAKEPGNGNNVSGESDYASNKQEGSDSPSGARNFNAAMNQNTGARAPYETDAAEPYTPGSATESMGNSFAKNSKTAEKNPLPVLSDMFNGSAMLSRKVSCSMFWGIIKPSAPMKTPSAGPARRVGKQKIMENIHNLCWNICDPIFQKEGSAIRINHGLRRGDGGSRHYIGEAVDLQFKDARNLQKHAELSQWIVDNLPYRAVYLEKMRSGNYVIHIESQPPGREGGGRVWTCRNASCSVRREGGIFPEYLRR